MKSCCLEEAKKSLKKHRDVATCDECGRLLLAYANDRDFEATVDELRRHGLEPETAESEGLRIVAKPRVDAESK
jgi:hypothetical protein